MPREVLSVRVSPEAKKRLDKATDTRKDPYAPTKAALVERGIELALQELKARR